VAKRKTENDMKMFYTKLLGFYVFSFIFKIQNTRKVDDTGVGERDEDEKAVGQLLCFRYWARAKEL
jgi:hypothetical protein